MNVWGTTEVTSENNQSPAKHVIWCINDGDMSLRLFSRNTSCWMTMRRIRRNKLNTKPIFHYTLKIKKKLYDKVVEHYISPLCRGIPAWGGRVAILFYFPSCTVMWIELYCHHRQFTVCVRVQPARWPPTSCLSVSVRQGDQPRRPAAGWIVFGRSVRGWCLALRMRLTVLQSRFVRSILTTIVIGRIVQCARYAGSNTARVDFTVHVIWTELWIVENSVEFVTTNI